MTHPPRHQLSEAPPPRIPSHVFSFLKGQGFLLGLAAAIALAAWNPEWGIARGPGLNASGATAWKGLIASSLFLVSGLSIRPGDLPRALADWRLHLTIQGFNLALLPALFWVTSMLLRGVGVHPALCLGLAFLGCLPTTTATAVAMTRGAGGDEAGALFNAALGSVLGVAVSPALLNLLTGYGASIPLGPVMGKLALQVLLPLALGQAAQLLLPQAISRLRPFLGRAGLTLLLILIWGVMCEAFHRGFAASAPQIALAVTVTMALHTLALALAHAGSGIALGQDSRGRRTAALLCGTQKSIVLGMPLLLLVFPRHPALGLIVLPLLIYHPLQLVSASLLLPRLRQWNDTGS